MVHHDSDGIGNSFFRFCLVGGVGFVADAIVLLTLIYGFRLHPLLSRIGSFSIAVALTFQLNRFWTFGSLRQQHLPSCLRGVYGGYRASGLCVISPSTLLLSWYFTYCRFSALPLRPPWPFLLITLVPSG